MTNPNLAAIIASGQTCYFISPHYDDAALSAGALMSQLRAAGRNRVMVINLFTQAAPRPYTLSAKTYLRQCGYTDAQILYRDRTAEDKRALEPIAHNVIDLGYTDALWRRRPGRLARTLGRVLPELGNVYPTYQFHIVKGRIARADQPTVAAIEQQLAGLINPTDSLIFCPLGIGHHIDHVIARAVCDQLFPNAYHWADYPYNLKTAGPADTAGLTASFSLIPDQSKKTLIAGYTSQYDAMFKNGPTLAPETFFYNP